MKITDMYGNVINFTDLQAAINQAENGLNINYIHQCPFRIDAVGFSSPIEGREHERFAVSEYWADALEKLRTLAA